MPFPKDGDQFPPQQVSEVHQKDAEYEAWLSGDIFRLNSIYSGASSPIGRSDEATELAARSNRDRLKSWYHGKSFANVPYRTHVKVPFRICRAHANILRSEPVLIKSASGDAKAQELIDQVYGAEFDATMSESSFRRAATGHDYMVLMWDQDLRDHVWWERVDSRRITPTFNSTLKLQSAIQTTFLGVDETVHVRELIEYKLDENGIGVKEVAIYEGTASSVGTRLTGPDRFSKRPLTAHWDDILDDNDQISTLSEGLGIVMMKHLGAPTIWGSSHIGSLMGRSAIEGMEHLFDEIDENRHWLNRELRQSKSRIFADSKVLKNIGAGSGKTLDEDQEVFVGLKGWTGSLTEGLPIEKSQFNIRDESYRRVEADLKKDAYISAGLSPQILGEDQSGTAPATAREIAARDATTNNTQGELIQADKEGMMELVPKGLRSQIAIFGSPEVSTDVILDYGDSIREDPDEISQRVARDLASGVISQRTAIQMTHSGWEKTQVDEELKQIREDMVFRRQLEIMSATGNPSEQSGDKAPEPAADDK